MKHRNCIALAMSLIFTPTLSAEETVSFKADVAPILIENCIACHAAKKAEGGYRLDTFTELQKPGDSGELPIHDKDPSQSEWWKRIVSTDPSDRMPADSDPLPEAQIAIIQKWISAGASFDGEQKDAPLPLVIPPTLYPPSPEHYPQPAPLSAMTFSPDGTQLLTSGYYEILVWDIESKKIVKRIANIGQRTFAIVFQPDNNTIAVGCGEPGVNGEVRMVDFTSGQVKHVIARTQDVVLDVAVNERSNHLAVGSADGTVRIINLSDYSVTKTIAGHSDWVTAVCWDEAGSRVATASRDKSAKVFDVTNGNLLSNYPGHAAAVRGVTFSPDQKQIISTGADKRLHRWDVEGAKATAVIGLGGESFKLVSDKVFALIPSSNSQLQRFEIGNNTISQNLEGFNDWVISSAYSPTSQRFAAGALNGEVRIWNATDNSLVGQWIAQP